MDSRELQEKGDFGTTSLWELRAGQKSFFFLGENLK